MLLSIYSFYSNQCRINKKVNPCNSRDHHLQDLLTSIVLHLGLSDRPFLLLKLISDPDPFNCWIPISSFHFGGSGVTRPLPKDKGAK